MKHISLVQTKDQLEISSTLKFEDSYAYNAKAIVLQKGESVEMDYLMKPFAEVEDSKFAGKIIKDIIKKINAERRKQLRLDIMNHFPDDGFMVVTKSGKQKGTGKLSNLLEDYDKSRVQFVNDDNPYFKFIDEHYKPANYEDVYRQEPELLRSYAADDIVIELWKEVTSK